MEIGNKYVREGVILRKIVCPLYIRRVKLSESRNKTYYEKGIKKTAKVEAMKRFRDKKKFSWRQHKSGRVLKWFMTDLETNERIISNPRSHSTPKWMLINGQDVHSGNLKSFARNKVMDAIKEYFLEQLGDMQEIDPKDYPVAIFTEIHNVMFEPKVTTAWDVDNHFLMYQKAFQDILSGNRGKSKKYIIDDNFSFITQPPSPVFIPIDNPEERKLVFYIVAEQDPRILSNQSYLDYRNSQIK